jgi:hypothetical protein
MKLRAKEWSSLLQSGTVKKKVEIAKRAGASRAYVTKVLKLNENVKADS